VTQAEPVQIRWHPGSSCLIVFAARIVMTAITTQARGACILYRYCLLYLAQTIPFVQENEVNEPPTTFTLDNVVTDAAFTEDARRPCHQPASL